MKHLTYSNLAHQAAKIKFLFAMYAKTILGKEIRIYSEDRRIMEEAIIPYYKGRDDIRKVLFVGCQPYTAHYPKLWSGTEFWTIEIDPKQKRYGSKNHIVDSVTNLGNHISPGYFDLIIFNGVYGYGVNTREVCEEAFGACYEALRAGGEFLMGWNQLPQYAPVPLAEIHALAQFQQKEQTPLGGWRYVCDQNMLHTYDFYVKPEPIEIRA